MSAQRWAQVKVALAWLPAALYVGLIWWISSQQVKIPLEVPGDDKGIHFLEYGVLGACFAHATQATWPGRALRAALASIWLTAGSGLLDELHQALVIGRTGDLTDLLADVAGAVAFVAAFGLLRALWRRRSRPAAVDVTPPITD